MLTEVSPIIPLPPQIVEQLKKIDDFYVCTNFTEEMIGPPIARIKGGVYFRFMNFIYSLKPPESLTTKQANSICDIRLEYIDGLVNYQLTSTVVATITDCAAAKHT